MRAFDLLVVGEINPDLVLRGPDVIPQFGQAEKLLDAADLAIGSSSVIMACAAARLGLRTVFVGLVGDDPFGRFMLDAMHARGIDTSACITDPTATTGISVILSRGDDRAILTHLGAIDAFRAERVDRTLLPRTRHLHVGSYFLQHALRPGLPSLFRDAKEAGTTTSLDTNWDPSGGWDGDLPRVLEHTDLVLPNEEEAMRLSGTTTIRDAIETLGASAGTVAIKRGGEGGLALRDGTQARAAALPLTPVDTTGAGDTFDAGFVYGTLHGWPLENTLRFACACGSLSTRSAGGTDAQPTRAEAEEAMHRT